MSAASPSTPSVANFSSLQQQRLEYEPPLPSVLSAKLNFADDSATTAAVMPEILGMFPGLGATRNVLAQVRA